MNQRKEVLYMNIGEITKVNILDACIVTNDSVYNMIFTTYLQVSGPPGNVSLAPSTYERDSLG